MEVVPIEGGGTHWGGWGDTSAATRFMWRYSFVCLSLNHKNVYDIGEKVKLTILMKFLGRRGCYTVTML